VGRGEAALLGLLGDQQRVAQRSLRVHMAASSMSFSP